MNKWLKLVALSLAVMLLSFVCFFNLWTVRVQAGFTDFITRSGDTLKEGTSTFRFTGTNVPLLNRAWSDPSEIEDAIRAAGSSGINVIRLYPFEVKMSSDPAGTFRHVMGPGDYNESSFKILDKIVQLANQHNIRLIVPFVDKYNYIGGIADWAAFRGKTAGDFWSDPTVKQDFKNFIEYVIHRTNTYTGVQYKNDKAILAWQLGNELTSTDSWVSEMAAYIKSLDSNHLVADGGYVRAQGIKANALNDNHIDIIDPHIYKYHNVDMVSKLKEWQDKTKGKKALIIGEFGDYSLTETEQLLNIVQNNGTTGAMFWGSMHHHKMGGWHWPLPRKNSTEWSYLRYPGFASGDWANESAIINLLRKYAYSMKGLTVPPWPAPDAPVMFPADSVQNLSWMGVSGASAYDVERSTNSFGPWTAVGSGVTDDIAAPRHHNFTIPIFDDASAQDGTSYYYKVKAKNVHGSYSPYSNIIGPITAKSVIIVDNGSSGYTETGSWGTSTLDGSYGDSSRYSSAIGSTATWKPNFSTPGYYNVYVRYPYHHGSATNAQYTVYHNGGTNTVSIDQTTIAGGRWRLIDTVYFAGGPEEYVKLTAIGSGSNYRADAVMFEPQNFGDSFQNNSSGNWTSLSGSWTLTNDVSADAIDAGNKVLKQSGTGIAETVSGSTYSDASITIAVKAFDNKMTESSSGLVARANSDFSNKYTLRINYDQNKVQLYKKLGSNWSNIGEADMIAAPGTWYLLKLELKGSSLKGYVNGVMKISVRDYSLTSGYFGLRTYNQTAVFDNIIVSSN
ncbi:cellulase family glycosylhydrolase [Paenibacillus alkaliterrae]|uniref:golvesin C-terminal-like domain-containing protein n=1 Tax=Paenibacillus alkaliterrae TaxID=320909 RepID=UPI001F2DF610|nr:family 16 glycoside hydrolase [Paenibacillus alkaliterrae]MCF2937942.1 cellulase family glycosylhydrolase [Paenibacillus alkaliterrae]